MATTAVATIDVVRVEVTPGTTVHTLYLSDGRTVRVNSEWGVEENPLMWRVALVGQDGKVRGHALVKTVRRACEGYEYHRYVSPKNVAKRRAYLRRVGRRNIGVLRVWIDEIIDTDTTYYTFMSMSDAQQYIDHFRSRTIRYKAPSVKRDPVPEPQVTVHKGSTRNTGYHFAFSV